MAGFQIPGLGHAVPNEILPPLSSITTSASVAPAAVAESVAEPQGPEQEAERPVPCGQQGPQRQDSIQDNAPNELKPGSEGTAPTGQLEQQLEGDRQDKVPQESRKEAEFLTRIEQQGGKHEANYQVDVPDAPEQKAERSLTPGEQQGEQQGEQRQENHQGNVPQQPAQATEVAAPSENECAPMQAGFQNGVTQSQAATDADDRMIVDQPESPPSLTHALEAAIGGLGDVSAAAVEQQPAASELQNDQGEHPEWEVDSAPYESSSESSSSDSSDEDSDNEGYELLGVEETARLLMEMEDGSDDEGGKGGKTTANAARTKNELPEEVIPKPELKITPEMRIEELGWVEHIVEGNIVVKAITPDEYQVLDTGSVLCTANREVIGAVAETLGKVLQPMYTVRFNSEDEVRQLDVQVGTKIYYPVDHVSYVFLEPLKGIKGSDASNIHDEEVAADEMEFSDDEKEAEHKRSQKQKHRNKHKGPPGDGGARAARGAHPLRQEMTPDGGLNYDDDGPYKPLARPPGFGTAAAPAPHEPEASPRAPHQHPRPGRRGGRRARAIRGRGDFGRGSARGQPRDGYSLPPQGYQQQHASPPRNPNPNNPWLPPAPSAAAPPSQALAPSPAPAFAFQLPPSWPAQPSPSPSSSSSHQPHAVAPPASHHHPQQLPPPPPPPPGWPAQQPAPLQGHPQQQQQQQQQGAAGTFVNPALIAALMSQLQTQNGGQQWGGGHPQQHQQQHRQPPSGGWQ